MQNNFNDIIQKMQSMQQMTNGGQGQVGGLGGQVGGLGGQMGGFGGQMGQMQGLNNQALIQNLLANNPQMQQYQAMMNMTNQGGMPFSPQFNNQNNPQQNATAFQQSNPQNANQGGQNQNATAFQQNANQNQNFNSGMPNFPNMPNGVDQMTLFNMMNNVQRQNAQTAPAKTGAVRRKSFGLSPIVGFANRDIIYSLTKYFAKIH